MGPNVKFVSPINGLISGGKNGGKFFSRKKDHTCEILGSFQLLNVKLKRPIETYQGETIFST